MESTDPTPRPAQGEQPGQVDQPDQDYQQDQDDRTDPGGRSTERPLVTEGGSGATGSIHLARHLAVYTVLRLGLVIALTAVLTFFMPLIVALLFAIIVQLPLAWLLFPGPRRRVNDAIAVVSARRRAERARLQSALSGETPVAGGPLVSGESTLRGGEPTG